MLSGGVTGTALVTLQETLQESYRQISDSQSSTYGPQRVLGEGAIRIDFHVFWRVSGIWYGVTAKGSTQPVKFRKC